MEKVEGVRVRGGGKWVGAVGEGATQLFFRGQGGRWTHVDSEVKNKEGAVLGLGKEM